METKDECLRCKNYSSLQKDGSCFIYGIPNHGISFCNDFEEVKE